jgi:UDP-N-acetylmuramyl pentapeptide synthase
LNISLQDAADALSQWEGAEGRMTVTRTAEGILVLDDCYNAGPESMEAALLTLAQTDAMRHIAVLGDMRELGEYAQALHHQVGRKAAETGVNLLITVGELAEQIGTSAQHGAAENGQFAPEVLGFPDSPSTAEKIREIVGSGDAVLIKGSRAMQMETIVAALTGQESPNSHA